MNTLLVIDGNAILHRAFHALPPFKTKTGIQTNAVYGFLTILLKAIDDFRAEDVVVCFDTPKPTFRKKILKEYQAHRPKMDDELISQLPIVREMLDIGGILRIEKEGYEADDLIGTIAKKYRPQNAKAIILTGDRDILQLVDNNIFVATPKLGLSNVKIYDHEQVVQKFGITPDQIPDFKALAGDQSDNYKGAKGIGPKGAANLIQKYHSVEEMFTKIESIEPVRIKEILKAEKENILISKRLAMIMTDVEIDFDIKGAIFREFKPGLRDFLQKFEMYSLVKRVFKEKKESPKKLKAEEKSPNPQMNLF